MSATEEAIKTAETAARAAWEKKGEDILAFDVSEPLAISDIFVVVNASNERQVGAIVDAVEEKLIECENRRPGRREGDRENRWVLLDYGDVIVHVQHAEERHIYSLERLWKDCPSIELELPEDDGERHDHEGDELA